MIFAILFVIAFAVGLVTYLITGKWLSAAFISIGLFVLNTLSDWEQSDKALYTILLGLPVVFCASLFGAYVVELRRGLGTQEIEAGSDEADSQPQNIGSKDESAETEDITEKEKNER